MLLLFYAALLSFLPNAAEPPERFIIATSILRITRNTRIPTFPDEDSDATKPSIITWFMNFGKFIPE